MPSTTPEYEAAKIKANYTRRKAPKKSKWTHRNGDEYVVTGYGIREADLAVMVGYLPVPPKDFDFPWFRPADEFFDGRFTRVEA